jgi:hypothetical protein
VKVFVIFLFEVSIRLISEYYHFFPSLLKMKKTFFFNQGNQSPYSSLWTSHHSAIAAHHHTPTENDWSNVLHGGMRASEQKFSIQNSSVDIAPANINGFSSRNSLQPYWHQLAAGNVPSFQAAQSTPASYGHPSYSPSNGSINQSSNLFSNSSVGNSLWSSDFGNQMRRCSPGDLRPRPYGPTDMLTSMDLDEQNELPTSDDLEQFAKSFKQRRIKLGR